MTAQPRSRSRSASGNSGAAAYPSPTSTQLTGSLGRANGRPSGPVTSTGAPLGRPASQRVPGPTGSTTSSMVAPCPPVGLTRWIQKRAAGRAALGSGRDRDEGAGPEAVGDAGRDQGEVAVGADLLGRQHLAGDVDGRPLGVAHEAVPDAARPRSDPARPQRALVDERGVALDQGGAGVEPGAGVLDGGDAADADQGEVGRRPGP